MVQASLMQNKRRTFFSHGEYDASQAMATRGFSCNLEIVRQGSLILFCDYVVSLALIVDMSKILC